MDKIKRQTLKLILFFFLLTLYYCNNNEEIEQRAYIESLNPQLFENDTFCGFHDPLNDIVWLNTLCNDAINNNYDLRYAGMIYLFNYEGHSIAYVNMLLDLEPNDQYLQVEHFFDCEGNRFSFQDSLKMREFLFAFSEDFYNENYKVFQTPLPANN